MHPPSTTQPLALPSLPASAPRLQAERQGHVQREAWLLQQITGLQHDLADVRERAAAAVPWGSDIEDYVPMARHESMEEDEEAGAGEGREGGPEEAGGQQAQQAQQHGPGGQEGQQAQQQEAGGQEEQQGQCEGAEQPPGPSLEAASAPAPGVAGEWVAVALQPCRGLVTPQLAPPLP